VTGKLEAAPFSHKLKDLLVLERDRNNQRNQRAELRAWMVRVQEITKALSRAETTPEARELLLSLLLSKAPYEFACVMAGGELVLRGVELSARSRARLLELAREARRTDAVNVVELPPDDADGGARWALVGSVTATEGESLTVLMGRTARTAGYYPGPWDGEIERMGYLLSTISHVYAAVEYRAALVVERNGLAEQVRVATQELREVSKLQRRFFELSLDMLCVAGFDGYFKQLNPAWSKVLGFELDELMSQPFLSFLHLDDHEATLQELAKLAAGHGTVAFEIRCRTRDGSYRWLLWSASPDPENQLIMAVGRDITLFKEAELRLREARAAAEAASQAKSDFLANMSHELRTPLNSVIGFTNILLRNKGGNLSARELDYLGRIGTNGRHLLRLINDVLDLSKVESGRVELQRDEIDLGRLVRHVITQLEDQAQASQTQLSVTIPVGLATIQSDACRLEQIVINLVGNAIKFAAGGMVEVRVRVDAEGNPLRLDVVDDGVGIPADKQAQVFESFRQADESTRRRFGGTGLGLSISRSLCETLGFRLELASEEGRGSLFAISFAAHDLPLVYESPSRSTEPKPPGASPAVPAVSEPGASQGNRTVLVLVIDDDADARAVLESYLQDYGCQIVAADSGERGIQLARQLRPSFITLDLLMAHMDGWSVLKALSEDPELRAIPVAICSIIADESRAGLVGAIAVLDKPIEREQLYSLLRDHLGDSSRRTVRVA
jgi:PAS domain S-box-containing protein